MAIDNCEPAMTAALKKAGWHILQRQVPIRFGTLNDKDYLFADLLLQLPQAPLNQVIVVEAKCLTPTRSIITDIYSAMGQYQIYRSAIDLMGVAIPIYLAIPNETYETYILRRPPILDAFSRAKIKMVLIDIVQERITRWIE